MSSARDNWETPQWLFDRLNLEFGFKLDPCCEKKTAKCKKYYTKEDDGLSKPWDVPTYVNPPYGRGINQWVEKARLYTSASPAIAC